MAPNKKFFILLLINLIITSVYSQCPDISSDINECFNSGGKVNINVENGCQVVNCKAIGEIKRTITKFSIKAVTTSTSDCPTVFPFVPHRYACQKVGGEYTSYTSNGCPTPTCIIPSVISTDTVETNSNCPTEEDDGDVLSPELCSKMNAKFTYYTSNGCPRPTCVVENNTTEDIPVTVLNTDNATLPPKHIQTLAPKIVPTVVPESSTTTTLPPKFNSDNPNCPQNSYINEIAYEDHCYKRGGKLHRTVIDGCATQICKYLPTGSTTTTSKTIPVNIVTTTTVITTTKTLPETTTTVSDDEQKTIDDEINSEDETVGLEDELDSESESETDIDDESCTTCVEEMPMTTDTLPPKYVNTLPPKAIYTTPTTTTGDIEATYPPKSFESYPPKVIEGCPDLNSINEIAYKDHCYKRNGKIQTIFTDGCVTQTCHYLPTSTVTTTKVLPIQSIEIPVTTTATTKTIPSATKTIPTTITSTITRTKTVASTKAISNEGCPNEDPNNVYVYETTCKKRGGKIIMSVVDGCVVRDCKIPSDVVINDLGDEIGSDNENDLVDDIDSNIENDLVDDVDSNIENDLVDDVDSDTEEQTTSIS